MLIYKIYQYTLFIERTQLGGDQNLSNATHSHTQIITGHKMTEELNYTMTAIVH